MAKIWNWIMKRPVFLIFIIGIFLCSIITIRHCVLNSSNVEDQDANTSNTIESTPIIFNRLDHNVNNYNRKEELLTSIFDEPNAESSKNVEETEPTEVTEMTETYDNEETTYQEIDSDISMDDAEMLAIVIYQEAGGDACCDECRRRVADIVLNRVADEDFPNTIYEVLTQYGQYGRLYWTGVVWADRASNPGEAEAVERARRIAAEVLNGQHSDVYGNGYIWQAGFAQGSDGFWHCGHFYGR